MPSSARSPDRASVAGRGQETAWNASGGSLWSSKQLQLATHHGCHPQTRFEGAAHGRKTRAKRVCPWHPRGVAEVTGERMAVTRPTPAPHQSHRMSWSGDHDDHGCVPLLGDRPTVLPCVVTDAIALSATGRQWHTRDGLFETVAHEPSALPKTMKSDCVCHCGAAAQQCFGDTLRTAVAHDVALSAGAPTVAHEAVSFRSNCPDLGHYAAVPILVAIIIVISVGRRRVSTEMTIEITTEMLKPERLPSQDAHRRASNGWRTGAPRRLPSRATVRTRS